MNAFAILTLVASFFYQVYRIYHGVDFYDEAACVAGALRLLDGQKNLVDDPNLVMLFTWITQPFVWIYLALAGSSDGIVLYLRWVYVLFNFGTLAILYFVLKRLVPKPLALLIPNILIHVPPHNMMVLNYNTLFLQLNAVTLYLFIEFLSSRNQALLFIGGLFTGLSVIAYPPAFILAPLYSLVFYLNSPIDLRNRALRNYLIGGLIIAVPLVVYLGIHWDAVALMLEYNSKNDYSLESWYPWKAPIHSFLRNWYVWLHLSWILPGYYLVFKGRPKSSEWTVPLFPIAAFLLNRGNSYGLEGFIYFLGFFALVFAFYLRKDPWVRKMFFSIMIPALAAAYVTSASSHLHSLRVNLGLLPAALLTYVLAFRFLKTQLTENRAMWMIAGSLAITFAMMVHFPRDPYDDNRFSELTAKVEWGAYKGLYTAPARLNYLEEIRKSIEPYAAGSGDIFLYYHFPAGYLLTQRKPIGPIFTFFYSPQLREPVLEIYKRKMTDNTIVIRINQLYDHEKNILPYDFSDDPLDHFIQNTHQRLFEGKYLAIFRPNSGK